MIVSGSVCIGSASLLSFAALIILIVANVAQINPGSVPRKMALVTLSIVGFDDALETATGDPYPNLYANSTNATNPGQSLGLRETYAWGFYAYCTYTAPPASIGSCSNSSLAHPFLPFDALVWDTPANYVTPATFFITNAPGIDNFINSNYFTTLSTVAYYLMFLATIIAAAVFCIGLVRTTLTFLIAALLALLGAVCLLISACLWTVMIERASTVNSVTSRQGVPLGISVHGGITTSLLWAAFGTLTAAVIPYWISCSTYHRVY